MIVLLTILMYTIYTYSIHELIFHVECLRNNSFCEVGDMLFEWNVVVPHASSFSPVLVTLNIIVVSILGCFNTLFIHFSIQAK